MSDDDRKDDPRPVRRSRIRRVARIIAIDLAILLLLVETVPRFVPIPGLRQSELNPDYIVSERGKRAQPHPYISYSLKPGWTTTEEHTKRATHNSLGFRGEEYPIEKPEGVFRIVCVGGSSTYGNGPTDDDKTWPSRLQDRLNKRAGEQRFHVINCGAPMWGTTESLINLALRGVDFDPDLVLVYHNTNDASPAMWPNPVWDNTHWREKWPVFRASPLEPLLERSMTYLIWRRYCTDHVELRADLGFYGIVGYEGENMDVPTDGPPYPEQGFKNFERNLISIVSLVRGHGAEVVFMTQAFLETGDSPGSFTAGARRKEVMDSMNEVLLRVASDRGVQVIDTKTELESAARKQLEETGKQNIFTNTVHLRNAGADMFARVIARELTRLRLVP